MSVADDVSANGHGSDRSERPEAPEASGTSGTSGTETPESSERSEPIELDDDERELVAAELQAMLPALSGERRERYDALARAVEAGVVPPDVQPQLGSLLELALQTARARRLYRAEGEKVLTAVYERTPQGRELAAQLRTINGALKSLGGAQLHGVKVRMRTLGHFTIALDTDEARVTLAVRPDSVNVESVSVS